MANIAIILVIKDNTCLLLKNNIEYIQAKFIKANKMIKRSMTTFFINSDLVSIQKYLVNYKNIDKIKVLIIELLYSNII